MQLRKLVLLALVACGFGTQTFTSAQATTVTDPGNAFLPTFVGAHNGDLDAVALSVTFNGSAFDLSLTTNGPIGTTAASQYVFGVNRGAGTPIFAANGLPGITFDAVITATGTGVLGGTDLVSHTGLNFGGSTASISGDTLSFVVPVSLLPTHGLSPIDYGFSVWPKDTSAAAGFGQIADFLPNDSLITAAVPEPSTWAMLLLGFAGFGLMARRRKSKPTLMAA